MLSPTRKVHSQAGLTFAFEAVETSSCRRPPGWTWCLCYCTHCQGLGCGGWCRWCP
jgi:hypothetical protein